MDLLGKMVQGQGCAVDGTVAAQNPLSRAMDSVLQARGGHARGGRHAPGGPQPGYVNDMQMQMQRQNFAHGADAQMLQGFEQEAMHRSRMEAAFRAGEMQQNGPMQAGPMMMHPHQAAFEAAFEDSKHAAHARFNGPMHHQPPPPQFMHQQRAHAQEAWVDDFQSLHMDDAWQSAGKSHQELAWEETKAPALHHQHHHTAQSNYTQQFEQASEQIAQDSARQTGAMHVSSEMARTMSQNPDPKWQNSEFLQFMHKVGTGELELDEEKNEVVGDVPRAEGALEGAWGDAESADVRVNRDLYESTWQSSASTMESAFADAAGAPQQGMEGAWGDASAARATTFDSAWDDSHSAEQKAFEGAWDEGDNLEAIWEKAMADAQTTDPFEDAWDTANDSSEYTYKADNPYLEASDNFLKGVEFFEVGHLTEAILAFEAEVQQHPENSEAWRMLGDCHAENDEDKSAIVCLERAVEEDPYNLSALLGLGVSNVNELNPQGALKNLKAWVQHNPKFHGLEIQLDEYSDGSLMDEVMQLMLQARAHDPSDSDVQVVLGVLYNVSKDYDAAANSFRMAAHERPNEYSLWNKLGATLANSSRSSEAIPSYHRALELKPRYARGWLNLGISHANLGDYEEATKCYLQALSLNARAEHIWSYLRICFTCMERFDLVKLADTRDVNVFRDEFKVLDL